MQNAFCDFSLYRYPAGSMYCNKLPCGIAIREMPIWFSRSILESRDNKFF